MRLEDSDEEYFYETKEERKIHNEHDKLVKKILEKPREVEFVVRKALGIKEKLEIEEVRNEFITIDYRGKQVDLLYKIKGKEVYLLIEHQSTQDVKMPYRILEYEVQIMDRSFRKNNYKTEKLAKVIAIVIYTGPGEWKMPQKLEEIEISFNYSKKILEEILPLTKENEREDVINILRYILVKDIGEEKAKEYIKKLEEGVIEMSGYVNYLRQDREATMLKMRNEGKSEGEKEGKIQEAIRVAKNMLKEKIDLNLIEKITGLKRSQFM